MTHKQNEKYILIWPEYLSLPMDVFGIIACSFLKLIKCLSGLNVPMFPVDYKNLIQSFVFGWNELVNIQHVTLFPHFVFASVVKSDLPAMCLQVKKRKPKQLTMT